MNGEYRQAEIEGRAPTCAYCSQPMVKRLHTGSGLGVWKCVTPGCWYAA